MYTEHYKFYDEENLVLDLTIVDKNINIEEFCKFLRKEKNMLNKIISRITGKTLKQIEKATSYDHYFNAEEAVEFGLCDQIIDFSMITGEMLNA